MDDDHIRELFAQFRSVSVRRMFGGAGLAVDGVTFAIVFDGIVYLKTDEAGRAAFEEEGSRPFVYPLMKKPSVRKRPSSFWRLPERLYDDPDDLARWAARSLGVAQRAKAGTRPAGKDKRETPSQCRASVKRTLEPNKRERRTRRRG
jgi:DNA transformation protein